MAELVVVLLRLAANGLKHPARPAIPDPAADVTLDVSAAVTGGMGLPDTEQSVIDAEFRIRFEHSVTMAKPSPSPERACG